MSITVYGIPTCGTVKKARAWLAAQGLDYEWVDLRETAPSSEQIGEWVKAFGFKRMRNTSGGAYRALGDEKKTWGDAEWKDAFATDAMLLKRPVVLVDGNPALVGFKEPDYLAHFK